MKSARWFGLLTAMAVLTACGWGISDYTKELAAQASSQLEQRKKEIEGSRQDLTAFLQSDESVGYRNAAESEEWATRLDTAAAVVGQAEQLVTDEIKPILDLDDYNREHLVLDFSQKVTELLEGARLDIDFWRDRKAAMDEVKATAPEVLARSKQALAAMEADLASVEPRLAGAKKEFPEQADQIDEMVAPMFFHVRTATAALAAVEEQVQAHSAGSGADYGVLASKAEDLGKGREQMGEERAAAEAKFAELSSSYSKTLIDMKADYALTIRRQSWDDAQEYPSMHDSDYQVPVEAPVLEYFDAINGSLASYSIGWFGDELKMLSGTDQKQWDSLNIDPKANWTADDTAAEFWLESATETYFHKYHVVENGETSETDWVPVDEAFFLANLDNLGMDVEAKPYGVFEENKLTHAAPPGMAYVGNPRYGRWENQGGGSVWTWIAPYLFYRSLFGSPWMYQRNEWNSWRTGYYGSRSYYGSGVTPMYGTQSSRTQTSSTFAGSQYGRSGGFSRPAGSVRGAGPSSRGGGFGGSGK